MICVVPSQETATRRLGAKGNSVVFMSVEVTCDGCLQGHGVLLAPVSESGALPILVSVLLH